MGVEPRPGDVLRDPPRERRRPPPPGRASDPSLLKLEKPAQVRLRLQRRAPRNLRRHIARAVGRVLVLVVGDLAAFALMRALLRAVRDAAVLGDAVAGYVQAALPAGMFNGWQFAAALLVALVVTGNYGAGDQRRDTGRLFLGAALATALPLWMTIWTRGIELVALQYLLVTMLVWAGLVMERLAVDRVLARVVHPSRQGVRTIFVGPAEASREVGRSAVFAEGNENLILGFVDVHVPPAPDALGHIVDFSQVVHETRAETVVVCGYLTDLEFHNVVDTALAAGCELLSAPRAIAVAGVQPTMVWRRGEALIKLSRPTLQGRQLFLKRVLDVTAAGVGLVLLSPVMLVIAVAIRLESRGPAVFGQRRLGRNGRVFTCYKFRSMRVDAEELLRAEPALYAEYVAYNYKLPEARDPRMTRVGKFLRKSSLDELPQLFNVLKGQMSLVGPRPIVPEELDEYGLGAAIFLSLKPGMTGAWAVNGRSRVGYPHRADIELDYVREWSLGRDLSILLQTFRAVVDGAGAE